MIEEMIKKYAAYGQQTDGSISRCFGSIEYREASLALKKEMQQMGMESYIDSVGNVHGIFYTDKSAEGEILIGSHLDTVRNGGQFDGLYGILAGLCCIKKLQSSGISLPFAVHIIATNGEEGNDLGGTFGSRCLTGAFSQQQFMNDVFRKKLEKFTVNAETQTSLCIEDIYHAKMDFSHTKCYLELHIEQGNSLEMEQKEIGIVTGIVGLRRYRISVAGKRNHSGTTKMKYRDDALVKASRLVIFADELARQYPDDFVATVQTFQVFPNMLAVINGEAEMVLEIRSLNKNKMQDYMHKIEQKSKEYGNIQIEEIVAKDPVLTDTEIQERIKQVCTQNNISYQKMASGATHDGNMFALRVPVGMIFVPSKDGISHNKEEWTEWKQCETGVSVLYETIIKLSDTF